MCQPAFKYKQFLGEKTMKKLLLLSVVLTILVALPLLATAEETVKLTMTYWNPETKDIMEALTTKFMKENPNISVELQQIPGTDYINVLKTRFLGGSGPDVYLWFGSMAWQNGKDGFFADITDEPFVDNIIDSYKQGSTSYQGRLYAVPLNSWANGVIYNKQIFEDAGVTEIPKTYSEFLAACEKIKNMGITPFARGAKDFWTGWHELGPLNSLIFVENPSFHKDRYEGKFTFQTSETFKNHLHRYIDLIDKGYIDKGVLGVNHGQAMQSIAAGRAAMVMGISVFYAEIKAANPDIELGIFQLPAENGKVAPITDIDKAIGYWPETKHPEEAKKLVAFWASPEVNKMFCDATQMIPGIKGVEVDFDEPLANLVKELASAETIFPRLSFPWTQPVQDYYTTAIQELHSGQVDLDQMLSGMDKVYEENRELIEPELLK
jgi:raffinose/stachyose/melibiose transport system substrate-binding protein